MSISELNAKVKELRELRRMAEELDAEITAIIDALKAHMSAENTDELTGADWRVVWKLVTTSRLDTKALRTALPDIVERFSRESTTRRFCVA